MTKKNTSLSVIIWLGIFAWPSALLAQTLQDTLKRIDSIFVSFNDQTPGASLTISRGGKVLYQKAFGMADLEHQVPARPETIFEAGSVSKQLTATSVLMLIKAGKVGLDDDVRKFIPELPVYSKTIKVRHLLNHTSGLKDWGVIAGIGGWPRGSRVYTNDRALEYITKQTTLNHTPGEEYIYSNSNYTLLTFIAERVSGEKLDEFTRKNIFEPLKMKHTLWRDDFKAIVKDRAIGYDQSSGKYVTDMPFENTYGHAALLTTSCDLDIWNASWRNSPLGGAELLKLRTEQGILNNGEKISYAGGVMIDNYNGHPSVTHSGATAGYRAWLAYYPKEDLSVAYLSNHGVFSTSGVGNSVAKIFFGERRAVAAPQPKKISSYKPDLTSLNKLAGYYYSEECGGEYTVTVVKGTIQLSRKHSSSILLKPVSANKFIYGTQSEYEFKVDAKGNAELLVSVPRARNVLFKKVSVQK